MGKQYITFLMLSSILLIGTGCDNKVTPSIYDRDAVGNDAPIIDTVEPSSVYALIDNITITGDNFSDNPLLNYVYFGNAKATILENSTTQLVVLAPYIEGDSLTVKVAASGAYAFGEYSPYKIEFAAIEYGGITETHGVSAVACADSEKVYICSGGLMKIQLITPESDSPEDFASIPLTLLSTPFINMSVGPNGYLYGTNRKVVYYVSPDGSIVDKYATLGGNANDIDFDINDNMFVASRGAIYCIQADTTVTKAATYDSRHDLKSLRIYDGYVYAAGAYTGTNVTYIKRGVWRNQILDANGTLGAWENVFDWGSYIGTAGPDLLSITFNADGVMYLGADEAVGFDAIYMLEPDGGGSYLTSVPEPLFPAVLNAPTNNFVWGSDQYLYVNRMGVAAGDKRLIRITTGKLSAPYYGRE
ncbi:MAG: IPT/TIG domain-containing protein [Candidatus Neomarinimicrobiota bacterium]